METKTERERERSCLSCKNNLWSHPWPRMGPPCLFILCSSLCSSISLLCLLHFFWCASAPEVKRLSLYNVQQRIAPSDGDVESSVGGDVCERGRTGWPLLSCSPFWKEAESCRYQRWNTKNSRFCSEPEDCVAFVGDFKAHLPSCFARFSLWGSLKPKLHTDTRGCFIPPYLLYFWWSYKKNLNLHFCSNHQRHDNWFIVCKQPQIITITIYFSTVVKKLNCSSIHRWRSTQLTYPVQLKRSSALRQRTSIKAAVFVTDRFGLHW